MTEKKCMLQAHRGVSSDRPENTMVAYREAVAQGYDLIELDPKMTKDNVPVLLHDKSINRTARDKDGKKIEGDKVFIADLTYAEACEYEYGSWFAEEYKGEHMPRLSEVLEFSKSAKIPLKFDNCMQNFTDEQLDVFFTVVEEVGDMSLIGFTGSELSYLDKVITRLPLVDIHYDGPWTDEAREYLTSRVAKEKLTVWLRFDNKATSWNKNVPANKENSAEIKKHARLGLWLLATREEYDVAVNDFGADVIETNGALKPPTSAR